MPITGHKNFKIVVSIALINDAEEILLSKRPKNKHLAGFWEFPGGKVETNEVPETALIREIKEELDIIINKKCIAPLSFSEFDYKEFQLLLLLYVCRRWEGEPKSMENNEIIWVKPNMLRKYKMPPADDALAAHQAASLERNIFHAQEALNGSREAEAMATHGYSEALKAAQEAAKAPPELSRSVYYPFQLILFARGPQTIFWDTLACVL